MKRACICPTDDKTAAAVMLKLRCFLDITGITLAKVSNLYNGLNLIISVAVLSSVEKIIIWLHRSVGTILCTGIN